MKAALLLLGASLPWAQTAADLKNSPPVVIYKTDPQYTEAARKAKLEGTVVVYIEVGTDGRAHNIRVISPLVLLC